MLGKFERYQELLTFKISVPSTPYQLNSLVFKKDVRLMRPSFEEEEHLFRAPIPPIHVAVLQAHVAGSQMSAAEAGPRFQRGIDMLSERGVPSMVPK